MSPKKLLVITYYWPPSGGAGVQRWVKFCKYLPDFNIEPFVLTVKNGTYPLVDKSLSKQVPDSLKVYKTTTLEPYSIFARLSGKTDKDVSTPATAFSVENESLIKKLGVWIRSNLFIPDARIGWVPIAFRKARKILREQDINTVITTGPPNSTHLIGKKLKDQIPGLNWIMDMRDPWSEIFYNESLPRTQLAQKIDRTLEKGALKTADDIIVVSDHMAELQKSIFNRSYHIIPNGFDHEDFESLDNSSSDNTFRIRYVGSMTGAAIPYNFFKALKALPKGFRTRINLDFYGSHNQNLKTAIRDAGLDDISSFKGYLPHLEAKSEMQSADLLLLVIPDAKHNELILTGKLFDYIAAGNPILYIGPEDGDAANIIKSYKVGQCFHYDEVQAITQFLEKIIKGIEQPYETWNHPLKEHPFSRYSLTAKISEICK